MPTAGIHLCVAKSLLQKKKINEKLFFLGNIAPDSWRNSTSTKDGSHFQVNKKIHYDEFYKKYKDKLDNPFVYGYLTHLITDYYWYGNNLSTVNEKYENKEIYEKERDAFVSKLLRLYEINPLDKIDDNFDNPIEELETIGINKTIEYINKNSFYKNNIKLNIFKIKETIDDIQKTVQYIEEEIKRLGGEYEFNFDSSHREK